MNRPEKRALMLAYLRLKVEDEDWHGVADAAMDLREIDAEERGEKKAQQQFTND